jgi:hypothetical protein
MLLAAAVVVAALAIGSTNRSAVSSKAKEDTTKNHVSARRVGFRRRPPQGMTFHILNAKYDSGSQASRPSNRPLVYAVHPSNISRGAYFVKADIQNHRHCQLHFLAIFAPHNH